MIEAIHISCPYCGEVFETSADCSAGNQEYIEDCQVCCQPINITLHVAGTSLVDVEAKRDDE
ncbi:CPXCG motif-containing cysteine-rich protein [Sulfuriflexus sp.]|uniref:CPXCG motif-containing cysteine-rich protein n=1 Tax=Sulfuriflexus sp. TaxID=2015443 RepID=UPI0028CCAF3B|nr:CPXCG motif-containing cysteine-rich protein [Sulfuriflexus sp.]MDT8403976.1 CPXCG motif-containing cysteine-rich protein [Sulfuriflexus sp.]